MDGMEMWLATRHISLAPTHAYNHCRHSIKFTGLHHGWMAPVELGTCGSQEPGKFVVAAIPDWFYLAGFVWPNWTLNGAMCRRAAS